MNEFNQVRYKRVMAIEMAMYIYMCVCIRACVCKIDKK